MLAIENSLTKVEEVNYIARRELELKAGDTGQWGYFEVNEDGSEVPSVVTGSPSKSPGKPLPAPPVDLPVTHCKTIAFRQVFTPPADRSLTEFEEEEARQNFSAKVVVCVVPSA